MRIKLTLLSWNLHGIPFVADPEARFARIGRYIAELRPAPDLLLLQEVWNESLADQLRDALTDYEVPALPSSLGAGWLGQRPSGLLALARKDGNWSIDDVEFHEFDEAAPWWRVWEGDGLGRKGVQQLRLRNGLDEVMLLHTHLQAMYGKPEYAPIAAAQLRQLSSVAASLGNGRAILAAGDLNTRIDSPRYRELRTRWIDLTQELRERCECGTSVREKGERGPWIDYVLAFDLPRFRVSADVKLIENKAPDDPYSDHNGFLAQLSIEQAPSAAWLLGAALAIGGAQRLGRRELLKGGMGALLTRPLPFL